MDERTTSMMASHVSKLPDDVCAAAEGLTETLALEELLGCKENIERHLVGRNVHCVTGLQNGVARDLRYIGNETPQLNERLKLIQSGQVRADDIEARKDRYLNILMQESLLEPEEETGRLLEAMARNGVFRLGGVLVGTHAFRSYELLLGVKFDAGYADFTRDVDIASFQKLSAEIARFERISVPGLLENLGYIQLSGLDPKKCWRWAKGKRSEHLVEFLTPSFAEEVLSLPAFSLDAQSLHHLNFLLVDSVRVCVLHGASFLIRVPRPERYAVHKMIISSRRHGSVAGKAEKDLRQAKLLCKVLMETRPNALNLAWRDASSRGRAWKKRLDDALLLDAELAATLKGFVI